MRAFSHSIAYRQADLFIFILGDSLSLARGLLPMLARCPIRAIWRLRLAVSVCARRVPPLRPMTAAALEISFIQNISCITLSDSQ
jgi:hypothetical protein